MGDPAGIGAEVAIKALSDPCLYTQCRPIVVGDLKIMADALNFSNVKLDIRGIKDIAQAKFESGLVDVLDLDNVDMTKHIYGKVSMDAGRAGFEYIRTAIDLAMNKKVDAVVTGPIHKEALNLAGYLYSGHTEIFADMTNTKDYAMMLTDGVMHIVHVSTHVSLRKACDMASRERVFAVIRLAHEAMQKLGISQPRIGVAGLNPHCGEHGLFGTEEIKEIGPAIQDARDIGIEAFGPIPADTLFAKVRGRQFDVAVAMYHDQGHIPLKTLGFQLNAETNKWIGVSGVNVTLGLPIIRTSVDHGVAFDQAGKGTANPESMRQAIALAVKFAKGSR